MSRDTRESLLRSVAYAAIISSVSITAYIVIEALREKPKPTPKQTPIITATDHLPETK